MARPNQRRKRSADIGPAPTPARKERGTAGLDPCATAAEPNGAQSVCLNDIRAAQFVRAPCARRTDRPSTVEPRFGVPGHTTKTFFLGERTYGSCVRRPGQDVADEASSRRNVEVRDRDQRPRRIGVIAPRSAPARGRPRQAARPDLPTARSRSAGPKRRSRLAPRPRQIISTTSTRPPNCVEPHAVCESHQVDGALRRMRREPCATRPRDPRNYRGAVAARVARPQVSSTGHDPPLSASASDYVPQTRRERRVSFGHLGSRTSSAVAHVPMS